MLRSILCVLIICGLTQKLGIEEVFALLHQKDQLCGQDEKCWARFQIGCGDGGYRWIWSKRYKQTIREEDINGLIPARIHTAGDTLLGPPSQA